MMRHGRKSKFVKRSVHQRGNVVWSVKVAPRSVPELSDGQKALWTRLNGDAFGVDAVAAEFKGRYGARGMRSGPRHEAPAG